MRHSQKEKRIKYKLDRIAMEKMAFKEAFQEWMDKKWDEIDLKFGRWSRKALTLLLFGAIIAFILHYYQGGSLK